ncbi:paraquat-inducible protein A [Ostreibacterium oceani]|uniref:Paraquat-inducible protein A n=1 Tax=Ostreibacterium oceani TaxID=2654998 RepID=A0A6N7ESG8_9GAMM|nr:paraquat-inducible protein A [Ostreibacterium oceani]MPV85442.1 hypothetical protein [Ostreibacterium oceani]
MRAKQIGLSILWLLVVLTYLGGILLPMATVKKFYFFENEFSLVNSMLLLAKTPSLQNTSLLIIIGLFTVIFPVAKLVTMALQIRHLCRNWQNKMTKVVETLGHFSMLDVFVIALMVILLKLRVLVDVQLHIGFYVFTVSIVASILLSFWIKQLRQSDAETIAPNAMQSSQSTQSVKPTQTAMQTDFNPPELSELSESSESSDPPDPSGNP